MPTAQSMRQLCAALSSQEPVEITHAFPLMERSANSEGHIPFAENFSSPERFRESVWIDKLRLQETTRSLSPQILPQNKLGQT